MLVDGQLLEAEPLTDHAILTGESATVALQSGDKVQAGDVNLSAPFKIPAFAMGEDSSLRQMAALLETPENVRNSYTALAGRAPQIYATPCASVGICRLRRLVSHDRESASQPQHRHCRCLADHHLMPKAIAALEAVEMVPITEVCETAGNGLEGCLGDTVVQLGHVDGLARALEQLLDISVTVNAQPENKLQSQHQARSPGARVLMVGNGRNDTVALAAPHTSIAPAEALEASRSGSDIVALKDSFTDFPVV